MDNSDKSIVAYTSFAIEDPKVWTSLCLFHDTVFIFEPWLPGVRDSIIKGFYRGSPRLTAMTHFHKTPRKILSEAGLIRIINMEDYFTVFSEFSREYADVAGIKFRASPYMGPHDGYSSAMAYTYAKHFNIPLVSDVAVFQHRSANNVARDLSSFLATAAISQLSLPDVEALDPECVLEAREALKDELAEFKAGTLKLTWLLNETVTNREQFEDLREKVNFLVQTKIKGSLDSLENKMKNHDKKKIQRLLVSTAKVLFHVVKMFKPEELATRIIAGSKSIFKIATEMEDTKPPGDQVATFLYQVKRKFNTPK